MCQICDAVDFQGYPGVPTRIKTSGLQQDYASYSVAASFETEPGGSIDFSKLEGQGIRFPVGAAGPFQRATCTVCLMPAGGRPWWRYAMNSVETSDLQCLPFIQFSYSNEIFISPCFLWWIHAYTDLVSRTDTMMTVLSWLHHIILWWLINIDFIF